MGQKSITLFQFAATAISQMYNLGRIRSAETYSSSLKSFMRFRHNTDIELSKITPYIISRYESYLKEAGICPNTSSFYIRNLRAIYNKAVKKGIIRQNQPFKYAYTGIDHTLKRAISIRTIQKIKDLDLSNNERLNFARDIFMFSFYTRGMSFVDIAYLKKSNISHGILSYHRRKTGSHMFIRLEQQIHDIINKYQSPSTPYLFPIITSSLPDSRRQYLQALHATNLSLKKIGNQLQLQFPLTLYVARHSWASIAQSKKIPISIISQGMGHNSEKTTRIYLASLDQMEINKANREIIKLLK